MPLDYSHFRANGFNKGVSAKQAALSLNRLETVGLPPFFDIKNISVHVEVPSKELASMVNATNQFYRTFYVSKRSGGLRQIDSPYPSLAAVQSWISHHIAERLPVHQAAKAYRSSTSIRDHIIPHCGKPELLKIDIKDFFPSITKTRILDLFRSNGYTSKAANLLAALVTVNGCLPQGGRTSPALSNNICFFLDEKLSSIAKKHEITFTRYADDFAFSGEKINSDFIAAIEEIFEAEEFHIHPQKTRHYRSTEKIRSLTGVVIEEHKLSPPKELRRFIRQKIFYLEKYFSSDLDDAKNSKEKSEILKNPFLLDSLRGKILYWLWLDPKDEKAKESLIKFNLIESMLL